MRLQVQEQPLAEEQRAKQIYQIYTIRTLAQVPATCLVRQADGSVGFFVQRLEHWRDVSLLETAMAALRRVRALPPCPTLCMRGCHSALPCACKAATLPHAREAAALWVRDCSPHA